ncbi:hypothetical protein [Streptomyces sp. NPDC003023]|uniref:hypothetical protein n=1 Tax=Streptomyces sp. NPDC003023 TaxID=3364675 RepID=UPI0036B14B97
MTNSADVVPARIPGYDGGPLTHRPELLDERLFWLGHLVSCAQSSEEAAESLLGADHDAACEFQHVLHQRADWPAFTVPLTGGHRLYVVLRTFEDDSGTDYLLHHPDWDRAEHLAQDDGHFMGPALSWPELAAAVDNGLAGGSTTDPDARLLLLLPALGDNDVPDVAVERLTSALRALVGADDPEAAAAALLESQGPAGTSTWITRDDGARVSDGCYSLRNPANRFALPPDRLVRVSAALAL